MKETGVGVRMYACMLPCVYASMAGEVESGGLRSDGGGDEGYQRQGILGGEGRLWAGGGVVDRGV